MASTTAIMCYLISLLITSTSCQHLRINNNSTHPQGICPSIYCYDYECIHQMRDCVTVVGNVQVALLEKRSLCKVDVIYSFKNSYFENLREVTGFVSVYRLVFLESLGSLFPNLTRIRGEQLLKDFALVVHDMQNMREVGLYNLLKIDRGGVIVWGGTHSCFVNTVNWEAITPNSRKMLRYLEVTAHCDSKTCKCGIRDGNHCWNNKKCQRFLSGPTAEVCHSQCLGCTTKDECSVCRHYTHQGRCVATCPHDTIVLPNNKYCITADECKTLDGIRWNNTCVFECPPDHIKNDATVNVTCEKCLNCQKTCRSLFLDTLSAIQSAERCVYILGSLTIHLRDVPGAAEEMKLYLSRLEEVTDYILIYGSSSIVSLDFFSSLRRISGRNLKNRAYSLIVHDMENLERLFLPNILKRLHVDRGKFKMYNNPKLCVDKVNALKNKFPVKTNYLDVPLGMNGYSGGCDDEIGLQVKVLNETAALVTFSPFKHANIQYTVVYAKVPPGSVMKSYITPETCSNSEWFAIHTKEGEVLLTSLHPASTYRVCIETYLSSEDLSESYIARTSIINFTTPFVKPKPPFIEELASFTPNAIRLRWVNHKDYHRHITRYQLDLRLIEIREKDLTARDHCKNFELDHELGYSRHMIVLKVPKDYVSCQKSCTPLIANPDNIIEEEFNVCDSLGSDCDVYEEPPPKNSSFNNYVKTLVLDIKEYKGIFQIDGLAPFRDYRIRLRACAGEKCSRSTRHVIRTLRSPNADIPILTYSAVDESYKISIKWEPPDETNGPVLAYFVEVVAVSENGTFGVVPDILCVYPNQLNLTVELPQAKNVRLRVCSSTLGSVSTCSDWVHVELPETGLSIILLVGIFFSILLIVFSVVIGFFYNPRVKRSEIVPLVNLTSLYRDDSETSNLLLMSDFMPIYSVPLSEPIS